MIGRGSFGRAWGGKKGHGGKLPKGATRIISNPQKAAKPPDPNEPGGTRIISNPSIKKTPNVRASISRGDGLLSFRSEEPSEKIKIAVVGRTKRWPWGQYPDELYLAEGLEKLGCSVTRIDQDSSSFGGTFDVALFTGQPSSWGKMPHFRGVLNVLWTLDWLPDFGSRKPIIEAAREASLFMSSDQFDWKSLKIKNHRYLPGACETVFRNLKPTKPKISCAFVGSLYNDRRKEIANLIRRRGGVVLEDSGSWMYGEDLSKFVQGVKVVVGDNYRNDIQGYWSTRNYVIPGAGGFLLTPDVPGLSLQFDIGHHLAVYTSLSDLGKKLDYWISHDVEREKIRAEGCHYTRARHSWSVRARSFLVHIAERVQS